MPERFADIVLPLAQPAYTFRVADGVALHEGDAVAVQFGAKNIYTGIVWRLHDRRPDVKRIKTVAEPLYDRPLLSREQMSLWEWTADYYMCTVGEVMRAALPSLMKPRGGDADEFAKAAYAPRTERYLAPARELCSESQEASELLDRMERRAPRQYEAMTELLELSGAGRQFVPRRLLAADSAVVATLIRKGLAEEQMREVTLTNRYDTTFRLPELSAAQAAARDSVAAQWRSHPTVLLHGVTGSGKTEIYIHFIAETVARGGDVLMLVPEIALTSQLIERMERIFGSRVTTYHSRLADRRRTETYMRLSTSSGGELVVGARSALFLPLRHLQLIIVDEEHDAGYKQDDPAPRYNARDCAVVMTRLAAGCRTLLGSATPSLESYMNARSGKYGYVSLTERYGDARMPGIVVSDTLRAAKRGERRSHFNKTLADRIGASLAAGSQVMLFQNRRGFAPYVECRTCGWTARCPDCNVTLTLHKGRNLLECHYCGHTEPIPQRCPSCRSAAAEPAGFGTEKIAEEAARMFPDARVVRLDADSATSERAYREIIASFARRESDIMVGTQMITKGLDFDGVSLVGIMNADNLLRNPDFRASERAFQLMMQVAGRAGRRDGSGEVVIQTSEPEHPVIRQVATGDYEAMAARELAERRAFCYPPYSRIVALTLRHRDPQLLRHCAERLAGELRARFGKRLLGPVTPPVDRIRGEYIVTMMLKIELGRSFARARQLLREVLEGVAADRELHNVTIICDVDPR